MKSSVTRLRQIALFGGDILCLMLGLAAALAIRYGLPIPADKFEMHKLPFAIIFAIWLVSFFISGLYSLRNAKNNRTFFALFTTVFAINAGMDVLFFYFIPYFSISPKTVLFLDLGFTLALLLLWRTLYNRFVSLPPQKIAILGECAEVDELINDIRSHPQQGYKCALHLKNESDITVHGIKNLPQYFNENEIDTVVVAIDYMNSPELQKSLFDCIPLHIRFYDFIDFYEQNMQKIPLAVVDRAWFLENLNEPGKHFFSGLKRFFDVVFTLLLGVIGIILMPFIALAVYFDIGRPIFFSQIRVGQFEKSYRIFKFRSMKVDDDEKSVSRFGKFLRNSHLDEIPQLWNIIRGEMSFVGPRPEIVHLVRELKDKIPFYSERLLVRPGIAGWAQLHEPHARAADALTKLQYDLFYIKHRSLLLDLEIILKTLRILLT